MDLDEIEEAYTRDIENADKEFLKALADKKDSASVEKTYSSKIAAAREKYYKAIEALLQKQKANLVKSQKKAVKAEQKVFKVDTSSLDLTPKQKKKLERELQNFKTQFARRNRIRERTPYFCRYLYFYMRLHLNRFFSKISDWFHSTTSAFMIYFKNLFEKTKESFERIMKYFAAIPDKIIAWLVAMKKRAQERREAKKKAEGTGNAATEETKEAGKVGGSNDNASQETLTEKKMEEKEDGGEEKG